MDNTKTITDLIAEWKYTGLIDDEQENEAYHAIDRLIDATKEFVRKDYANE